MKILLLGSNGYIGRHLYLGLSKITQDIDCAGRQEKSIDNIARYRKINIADKESLRALNLDQYDYIFFFSGLTGTSVGFKQYESFYSVNEIGLLNVLDLIKDFVNKPKIIFPSTRLVYKGAANTPLIEDSAKEPKTIYALNKLSSEMILKMYSEIFGIKYTTFRICVPYGNTIEKNNYSYGTIGFFISNALQKKDISLYGTENIRRTFTYIEDLIKSIVASFSVSETANETYNIGGETLGLIDVANSIATQFQVNVLFKDYPEMDRKIETGDTIFDSTKLDRLNSFTASNRFEDWIKNYFNK